jgi:hypothetical protein
MIMDRMCNNNDYAHQEYSAPDEYLALDATLTKGIEQFENPDLFKELTKQTFINTETDVISCIITYDS